MITPKNRLLLQIAILAVVIPSVLALNTGRAATWKVTLTGDRLTVRAVSIPLKDILEAIAAEGVGVHISPGINPRVSAVFQNEPIATGLDRILGSLNHVLVWRNISTPLGPITRLAEIQIYQTGARDAMEPLKSRRPYKLAHDPKTGAAYVRREILLGLGPRMDAGRFQQLLAEIGGTVLERHGGIGIYRIRIGSDENMAALADRLNAREGIARAEPNWAYNLPAPNALAGRPTDSAETPLAPTPGAGVPIAVLDTGLQNNADLDPYVVASFDAVDKDAPISDSLGHGTQMALIASGAVTPLGVDGPASNEGNPLIAVRAFDDNGVTSNFTLMQSMDFALAHGARVMSLSWGTQTPSPFLENTMNYGRSQGLVIVAAAGNEPTGTPYFPAAYPSVIGVGALDDQGNRWQQSNYGDFVTLNAPGFATLPVGHEGAPGTYAGTSIATAYAANYIAAALAEDPEAELATILAKLATAP